MSSRVQEHRIGDHLASQLENCGNCSQQRTTTVRGSRKGISRPVFEKGGTRVRRSRTVEGAQIARGKLLHMSLRRE